MMPLSGILWAVPDGGTPFHGEGLPFMNMCILGEQGHERFDHSRFWRFT